jgi:hypothetical protein
MKCGYLSRLSILGPRRKATNRPTPRTATTPPLNIHLIPVVELHGAGKTV